MYFAYLCRAKVCRPSQLLKLNWNDERSEEWKRGDWVERRKAVKQRVRDTEKEAERGRNEQRQHWNTSNEDEQQRESVTEDWWLIDGSDQVEDECLNLTVLIIRPAYNSLPSLATQWHHCAVLRGTLGVSVAEATGSHPTVARRQSPWRCILWGCGWSWVRERVASGLRPYCLYVCAHIRTRLSFIKHL